MRLRTTKPEERKATGRVRRRAFLRGMKTEGVEWRSQRQAPSPSTCP